MKILIVSDTHRQNENYFRVIDKVAPVDMVIHCGDVEGGEYIIEQKAACPVEIVLGNNDYFSELPREKVFMIGSYKVWLTHGHNYYVTVENGSIKREAISRGVDIVMYGHTHRPVIDIGKNITAINPGSLTYPRQDGRKPSYIIMEIDGKQKAHFTINYL